MYGNFNYLIQSHVRMLLGRRDTNIGTADQLLRGKDRAKRAGKGDNAGNGIGRGIRQPILFKGWFGETLGETGIDHGTGREGTTSSDTVWVNKKTKV